MLAHTAARRMASILLTRKQCGTARSPIQLKRSSGVRDHAHQARGGGRRAIEQVLGGNARRHDRNEGESKHDLDICMPDGSVIALEVTQDMAQARENQRGALENLRWKFDQLGREWFVDLLDNAWVNDLHTRLPELLGQLERKGITELKVPRVAGGDDERTDAGTVGEFRDLGVLSCRSYESGDDSVGAVHTDQIVDAVWGRCEQCDGSSSSACVGTARQRLQARTRCLSSGTSPADLG